MPDADRRLERGMWAGRRRPRSGLAAGVDAEGGLLLERVSSAPALIALASLVLAAPAAPAATPAIYADWASVLARHVDARGRIDFDALAARRAPLERFVAWLGDHGPRSQPDRFPTRAHRLAYHVNAYNALAMHGVLRKDIPEDLDGIFKRIGFFKLQSFTVDGRRTSLHAYENEVIRPLGEPRVHFALNCMVRGCPRLPREPFEADGLDARLEAATREFFSAERHLQVDHAERTVWVSAILEFYTEDFVNPEQAESLIAYINRYREPPVPENYGVRFLPYDWTINRQPD